MRREPDLVMVYDPAGDDYVTAAGKRYQCSADAVLAEFGGGRPGVRASTIWRTRHDDATQQAMVIIWPEHDYAKNRYRYVHLVTGAGRQTGPGR